MYVNIVRTPLALERVMQFKSLSGLEKYTYTPTFDSRPNLSFAHSSKWKKPFYTTIVRACSGTDNRLRARYLGYMIENHSTI